MRRALRRALAGAGNEVKKATRSDGLRLDIAGQVVLEPDILWLEHGALRLVADAKYKQLAAGGFQHGDLYQMHAYCAACGLSGGLLGDHTPAALDQRR